MIILSNKTNSTYELKLPAYSLLKKTFLTLFILLAFAFFIWGIWYFLNIAYYHKFVMSITLIAILICVEILLTCVDDTRIFKGDAKKYTEIILLWSKKQSWLICYMLWLSAYYFISGMSLLSSCVVIYITSEQTINDPGAIVIYSILSLLLTFVNLLVNPFNGSKAYRNAYIKMETEIIKYIANETKLSDLYKVFDECEKEITNGIYAY